MRVRRPLRSRRLTARELLLRQVPEKQFMASVIELAKAMGYKVYHTHDSRRSESGYPDLHCVKNGKQVFIETKSRVGKLTPAQEEWLQVLSTLPGATVMVARPGELEDVKNALEA